MNYTANPIGDKGGEWVNLHAVAHNCEGSSEKEFVKIIMKLHCN